MSENNQFVDDDDYCELFDEEMDGAAVFAANRERMLLRVNPIEGIEEPHFIILDENSPHTTKICGISILAPKYVHIPLEEGIERWFLDEEEKKKLCQILNVVQRFGHHKKKKTWKVILEKYNHEAKFVDNSGYPINLDLPKPNYLELTNLNS